MSDHFTDQNNAKLSNSVDNLEYFQEELNESTGVDDLNSSYDHMYATNHEENGLTEEAQTSCQTSESEVNFLKQFLLIHLDLIQQQSDDILNKENTIFILQQENERLRERLRCMESGSPFQSSSNFTIKQSQSSPESFSEDMTLDSGPADNDNTNVVQIPEIDCQEVKHTIESEGKVEINDNHLNAGAAINSQVQNQEITVSVKQEPVEIPPPCKESDASEVNFSNSSYTIHSNLLSAEPMKNLKMSIRRKRLCSNSSAVSNNDSMSDEKRSFRRSRKKRKRIVKNDQIHTYNEQYVTQVGEQALDVIRRQELADEAARAASTSNLEVPRWRVKVYTSCYSMEGTENLEDEAFLRRHNRLENDERRRKRWDVQRIREQRIVEKLKQRQEKMDSNHRSNEQTELIETLWPSVDDIKYIELTDVLPVSAFGCPIPKLEPSEFNLPWLANPSIKKANPKKSTSRRRSSRR